MWQFCGGGYNSASVAIKGNFFNSGPYTAFIAIGVAMAIVWLRKEQQFGGWKKSIMIKGNLFVLFVGMVMLALIRSRSAIVAVEETNSKISEVLNLLDKRQENIEQLTKHISSPGGSPSRSGDTPRC